ncbi:histidine phosphatase family protein [Phytoactinopolyspora limicola]|uniref:histidine phosphatase family protein n=1 Tax=Phytoactinopolyspora limicola TaxID=2715536 RepID=UPI001409A197|nr:histidine phosphatase family protein [Phytoactinopolyspora limicola]
MSGRWGGDEPAETTWRRAQLVLIRHGESEWNAERRVQGQLGTGLTARGQAQARAVAQHLITTYPDPAFVVSSDLERVLRTAEPYLAHASHPAELDKRLREIDAGEWSGLLMDDVAEQFSDELAAIRHGADIPRGRTGETFVAMRSRVTEALHDIARRTVRGTPDRGTKTALVFTHGGPVRVAVAEALGLPPGGHRLLAPPANCSVTVLTLLVDPDDDITSTHLSEYNSSYQVYTGPGTGASTSTDMPRWLTDSP